MVVPVYGRSADSGSSARRTTGTAGPGEGWAFARLELGALGEAETPVTNDLFVQHLRGVPADAEIVLEGRLIRRSRRLAWTEARALANGELTTQARITKSILSG